MKNKIFTNSIIGGISVLMILAVISGCKPKAVKVAPQKVVTGLSAIEEALYREDAYRIVLREINSSAATSDRVDAYLPKDRVDRYFDILMKCRDIWRKADSIPDLGVIHTLPKPDMKKIIVTIEKTSSYYDNWSNKRTFTGNMAMQQLINHHKLAITDFQSSPDAGIATFESNDFLNTPELASNFRNFEGIISAEASTQKEDGNNIDVRSDSKNGMMVRFSIGAKSCETSCSMRKYWNFMVQYDGSVMFLETKGLLPPESEPKK